MTDPTTVLGCASAALAAAGMAALVVPPTPRLAPRVRPYTVTARTRLGRDADHVAVGAGTDATRSTVMRLFGPPGRAAVASLGRLLERRRDETLALQLHQAGYHDVTPEEYRTRLAVHVLAASLAGAALGALALHSAPAALSLAISGAVFGASRLRGRLERAIATRRERLRLELYTVNQLLAMHVRTGAGPVQATQRVVDRGAGAAVEELTAVLTAMRNGLAEPEAFRRGAELTPEPAAARTYKLFAAGAERGVDLADGLRALSEDLRDARREEIRQTATKRRAAMLVPTIAVLAPVMLLFIAAPLPSIVFGGR
jgi:tight adherence protein C